MCWCAPLIPAPVKAETGESQVQDQPGELDENTYENEVKEAKDLPQW